MGGGYASTTKSTLSDLTAVRNIKLTVLANTVWGLSVATRALYYSTSIPSGARFPRRHAVTEVLVITLTLSMDNRFHPYG